MFTCREERVGVSGYSVPVAGSSLQRARLILLAVAARPILTRVGGWVRAGRSAGLSPVCSLCDATQVAAGASSPTAGVPAAAFRAAKFFLELLDGRVLWLVACDDQDLRRRIIARARSASMRQQNGPCNRILQDVARHPTQQYFAQAAMRIGAHHEQPNIAFSRRRQ
jgi:hypothetical protein